MARGPFGYRPGEFSERFFGGRGREPLERLQREMNRVFDELWRNVPGEAESGGSAGKSDESSSRPHVDVHETADAVEVCLDLPGVKQDDIDINLDDDRLTIRAERRRENRSGGERAHTVERSTGVVTRSVRLPTTVDPDAVQARFEHGVLTVTLPKPKSGGKGRRIPIGGGATTGASDHSTAGGATGETPMSGSVTGGAGGEAETGPSTPGGAVHGYND